MNSILKNLQQRISIPAGMLIDPAPNAEEIEQIIQAAVTAPDHGGIRPWRFVTIRGDARNKLGQVFCDSALANNPALSEAEQQIIRQKALRAPLILMVVAAVKPHPKVSADEQAYSAAAATQNVLLAADSLGFGSIWLTGPFAANPMVTENLGLNPEERIVAFVYLGTPSDAASRVRKKTKSRPPAADFLSDWNP